MAKFLKILLLLLIVAAVVWVAAMWRWHSQGVNPGGVELLVYLVVLPMALTAGLVVGAWQLNKVAKFAASPLKVSMPPSLPASAEPEEVPPKHSGWMLVLAAYTASRLGNSWQSAQHETAAGTHGPQLHARFKDGSGQPAFTAEWKELQLDDAQSSWDAFVESELADANGPLSHVAERLASPPPDVLRALSLLTRCFVALQPEVSAQWAVLASTGLDSPIVNGPPPRARIEVGLPARWPQEWRQGVEAWVKQQLAFVVDEALKIAGQSAAMAETPQAVVQCTVHSVADDSTFWSALGERQRRWIERGVPGLMWVVMADSHLSQTEILDWHASGRLMGLRPSKGQLPGEAGATLLMATPQWIASPHFPKAPVLARLGTFSPRSQGHQDSAATSDSVEQLVERALQEQGVAPESVTSLSSDTDLRPALQAELLNALEKLGPQLEFDKDVLCLGMGCGETGVARWALSLALTAQHVGQRHEPALVVSHTNPAQRSVAVLTAQPPSTERSEHPN